MRTLILIALTVASLAYAQQPDRAYVEAVKLQQSGDLDGAVAGYRSLLESAPGHVGARSNLGAALAALGRYDEAITEYKHALALMNHPGIRRNLALAYYKSGRLAEAIAELKTMRAAEPANVDLAVVEADCHLRLGDEKAVIDVLAPLSEKNPGHMGLAYLLGTAYIRDGRVQEGQVLIDKILGKGESAEAHLLLGMARERGAELEAAAAEFEQAVKLNPRLPTAWAQLGVVRMKLNDRDAAAEAFRKEIQGDRNNFDANFYLGVILRESGQPDEALSLIEHAVHLRPESFKAQYQLGSLLVQLKEYSRAAPVLEELLEKAPEFPEAHVSLATAYLRLGEKEKAVAHRKAAQKLMTAKKQPE